jgi:protein TonB
MQKRNAPLQLLTLLMVTAVTIGLPGNATAQSTEQENTTNAEADESDSSDTTFIEVEQKPEFPGGKAALFDYLKDKINYPEASKKARTEGKVVVRFIVNKDGTLSDIEVEKSVSELLDQEAKRVVKAMPPWKPGRQDGEIVRVRYRVPIQFSLN